MSKRSVLIVSTIADVATDDVVQKLRDRGVTHTRINTEDFPFRRTLTCQPERGPVDPWLWTGGTAVLPPTAVWYRRLRTPPKPDDMDEGIYDFCLRETRDALIGAFLCASSAHWMNYPASTWRAEFKPYQLGVASRLGIPIPKTIITNDPDAIRDAMGKFGRMIVKAVRSGHFRQGGTEYAIFTSQVLEHHLQELESARLSPSIYQALVPKKLDVRVTIVGNKIFPAAIDSQSDPSAVIDWRHTSNPDLPHKSIQLPSSFSDLLLQLMHELDLSFGCIDLIQTEQDEYTFLEVNPSGEWLWIDHLLGSGISDAIADWLAAE